MLINNGDPTRPPPNSREYIVKKNILAIGILTVAILGGAMAVAATGLVGTASAQTPTTAEAMVTGKTAATACSPASAPIAKRCASTSCR